MLWAIERIFTDEFCAFKIQTRRGGHRQTNPPGEAVLRELKSTLEDLEDRRELAAARKRNAGKPGTSLRQAAKELGL